MDQVSEINIYIYLVDFYDCQDCFKCWYKCSVISIHDTFEKRIYLNNQTVCDQDQHIDYNPIHIFVS